MILLSQKLPEGATVTNTPPLLFTGRVTGRVFVKVERSQILLQRPLENQMDSDFPSRVSTSPLRAQFSKVRGHPIIVPDQFP
jgi:hypothetical protein